jgi:hypothetical protein
MTDDELKEAVIKGFKVCRFAMAEKREVCNCPSCVGDDFSIFTGGLLALVDDVKEGRRMLRVLNTIKLGELEYIEAERESFLRGFQDYKRRN